MAILKRHLACTALVLITSSQAYGAEIRDNSGAVIPPATLPFSTTFAGTAHMTLPGLPAISCNVYLNTEVDYEPAGSYPAHLGTGFNILGGGATGPSPICSSLPMPAFPVNCAMANTDAPSLGPDFVDPGTVNCPIFITPPPLLCSGPTSTTTTFWNGSMHYGQPSRIDAVVTQGTCALQMQLETQPHPTGDVNVL